MSVDEDTQWVAIKAEGVSTFAEEQNMAIIVPRLLRTQVNISKK